MSVTYTVEWVNQDPKYHYVCDGYRISQAFTSKRAALKWAKLTHNKQSKWFGNFTEFEIVRHQQTRTVVEKHRL